MRRLLLLGLFISSPAFADLDQKFIVEEADGSPSTTPYKLIVSNGSLTDNADGTSTVTTGAAASGWTDGGTDITLTTTTDDVIVGPGASGVAKFHISGDADQPTFVVKGHTTQTGPIFLVRDDTNTNLFNISDDGTVQGGGSDPVFIGPYGTAPTLDENGAIAVDSTQNQLLFRSNGITSVVPSSDTVCYKTYDLTGADDNTLMWFSPVASTVTAVGCRMSGDVATLATIALTDGAGNAMTHTAPTCVSGDTALTFQAVTAANTLVAGESLTFSVTNTPASTTNEYVICAKYNETRQ